MNKPIKYSFDFVLRNQTATYRHFSVSGF